MLHLTLRVYVESGPWHYDVVTDSCVYIKMSNKIINLNWSTTSFNHPQHTLSAEPTV